MSFTTGMILSKQCHIEMPQTILQENVYRTTCINKHVVSFPLVVSSVIGMAKTSTQPSDPPHSIVLYCLLPRTIQFIGLTYLQEI